MAQSTKSNSVLRHVVMFGWNSGTDQAHIDKVVKAFGALQGKISLIKDFEWGVNNSPEKLNQGLTHCFFVTFHSEADRDAYLIHPDHQAFVALLNPAPDIEDESKASAGGTVEIVKKNANKVVSITFIFYPLNSSVYD